MATSTDEKEQVQQATDIVRLIGEHVALKAKGREFVGLCPFHDDRNPSMTVSPAKQIYKCFVCGAGGDVFSFAMGFHKMSFPEALKYLAERGGITLAPRGGQAEQAGGSERQRLREINDRARSFFMRALKDPKSGEPARQYIEKRGISAEMVTAFELGYGPDGWSALADHAAKQRWNMHDLVASGLVKPRQQGDGVYDALRHRLVFPILDDLGRPIAFGARRLREEDNPKYLNSPETVLFNKSATLYGLHQAKRGIIATRTAVVVEGYTDVIACHQAGLNNVVATLGTALTPQHAEKLRPLADRVVLIFDADAAGQKAADRAVEIFLTESLDVAVAILPQGLDPDELVHSETGKQQWHAIVENAADALEYQLERMSQDLQAQSTITGRQRLAQEYLEKLAGLGLQAAPTIRKAMVVQRLSALLHLSEAQVREMTQRLAKQRGPSPRQRSSEAGPGGQSQQPPRSTAAGGAQQLSGVYGADGEGNAGAGSALPIQGQLNPAGSASNFRALQAAERHLIGALLRQPDLFHTVLPDGRALDEAITAMDCATEPAARLYEMIYQRLADGESLTIASLLGELAAEGEPQLAQLATSAEAEVEQMSGGEAEELTQILTGAVASLQKARQEQEYRQVRQHLLSGEGQPTGEADALMLLKRKISEHQQAHPSTARILRPGK